MEPFLGQITMVGFPFAPRGYAQCDGALLSIQQNSALFSLLGTTYGGDGITTFRLPDMRGRAAMFWSNTNPGGTSSGSEGVTLTAQQIPSHFHTAKALVTVGAATTPANGVWAASARSDLQYAQTTDTVMAPTAFDGGGGSNQPHNNMQPSLVINFVIAVAGIYPPRN